MPSSLRTLLISASACLFVIPLTQARELRDLRSTAHADAIHNLQQCNVVSGYPDGTFRPAQTVNRAEFLKLLISMSHPETEVSTYNSCFSDVRDEWFVPSVCFAKERGWVEGYPDGLFRPAATVNIVEAMKMLAEAMEYTIGSNIGPSPYTDVPPGAWYAPYVDIMRRKWITLRDIGRLGADAEMEREIAAGYIYRAFILHETGHGKYEHVANADVPSVTGAVLTACTFTQDLSCGARGEDIACLQTYLQAAGFYDAPSITGVFGPSTRDALIAWQQSGGHEPSGVLDEESREIYAQEWQSTATNAHRGGGGSGSGTGTVRRGGGGGGGGGGGASSDSSSSVSSSVSSSSTDSNAPILAEVTAISSPTGDPTPDYNFSTTEAGTISYGGSCASATTNASSGSNTVTFNVLSEGTYNDCTITVTDGDGNASDPLFVSAFTIDTTAPTVAITAPTAAATVTGGTVIIFTDDEETAPECSVDNSSWTDCISGTTTFSQISGWSSVSTGSTLTLYLRDIDAAGNTGTDSVGNLTKGSSATYLLDDQSGAYAAFSLRRLSSDYEGDAIEVRRESDSTTNTIGFTATGALDVISLESFCAGTDCFVKTWYDQSGSGYHLSQSTASLQPLVASGGNILRDEQGIPRVSFDASTSQALAASSISPISTHDVTLYAVAQGVAASAPEEAPFVRLGGSTNLGFNLHSGRHVQLRIGGTNNIGT